MTSSAIVARTVLRRAAARPTTAPAQLGILAPRDPGTPLYDFQVRRLAWVTLYARGDAALRS